ncbi:hypothetical protein MMC25_001350 [Agyrium rufum]|nr:hypothetical protein [Agyrium rufum]
MRGQALLSVAALALIANANPVERRATATSCTVTEYSSIPSAIAACTDITLQNVAVPGGQTLDISKLQTGTKVTFAGTTTFGYYNWTGNLMQFGGKDITITSAVGAIIDGNGQAWWDGQGSNGGILKPDHFITVKATGNSLIENLHIRNYPTHCFSISSSNGLLMQNMYLDNTAGNAPNARSGGLPAAHNTDGFDISSTSNMTLRNSVVLNQDDCVAITSGNNVTSTGMYCDGGHGLSIGSVGGKSNNNVTNIYFTDSIVLNSQNGARIKSNFNTTGFISNIQYRNIAVANISIYGIDVQQDYLNGGPTGNPSNGVIIQDLLFENIVGTAQRAADDYYILCGAGSCSNFTFKNVAIIGGGKSCNFHGTGSPC